MDVGTPQMNFERLFGDNEELNQQTNLIINQNIRDLVVEFLPVIKQIVHEFVVGTTNRIFDKFSFDELFPDP